MSEPKQTYLGDGVYASFDGYHIWLTTSDGYSSTNRIALEPPVYNELITFAQSLRKPVSDE